MRIEDLKAAFDAAGGGGIGPISDYNNGEFIALAHNVFPALLKCVEALLEIRDRNTRGERDREIDWEIAAAALTNLEALK